VQGQQLAEGVARERAEAAAARREAFLRPPAAPSSGATLAERAKKWRDTGIVALRDAGLAELPAGLLDGFGPNMYAVDVGNNRLTRLPG